jgi:TonB-linked SusC/RagA family outer membrane protein
MRLTTVILIASLLQVSAATFGQSITIAKKNISLETVLMEIHKQSGYDFYYDGKTVPESYLLDISVNKVTVNDALKSALAGLGLVYKIEGKMVTIKKAATPSFLERVAAKFAAINVTGVVVDEEGIPLAGATVIVKGTNKSTQTSTTGNFMLTGVEEKAIISISYIGFAVKEIKAAEKLGRITMTASTSDLGEVSVISTGYETISKERATGSVTVITAKMLEETPTISLIDRLEGRVPGVRFDNKSNTIQIRSSNNYSNNTAPLIVVDGFPLIAKGDAQTLNNMTNSPASANSLLSNFNPADIEQITFLKDAAATSIWGARGANGVIVITTKKGKKGAPSIALNYTFGVSQPQSLSKLNWMNSAQYVDLEQEMVTKGFLVDPKLTTGSNALYVRNNSEATEWMYRVTATAAERDAALGLISARNNQAQIEDLLFQNAITQQYNLSVSGGSENTSYYISGNYNSDRPVYKSNQASNAFLNATTTSEFFNNRVTLRTGLNYQYAKSVYNGAAIDALSVSNTALRPYDLLLDENGNTIKRNSIFVNSIADDFVAKGYLPFSYNAVDELNYSKPVSKTNQVRFTADLNGKITSWMNVDLSGMSQRTFSNMVSINEIDGYTSRILVNTGTSIGTNGKLVYGVPLGGTYNTTDGNAYDNTFRGQVNFNPTWGRHQLVALAGTEMRETYSKSYGSTRYGYNGDTNTSQSTNAITPYTTLYGYTQPIGDNLGAISEKISRYLSYYANASYTFDQKYIVSGSVRFDDFTLLGVDRSKRAIPLWSAGLKWNAKNERFLQDVNWLSNVSLRATLGTGGSVPLAGSNITVINVSGTDSRTGQPIASISNPGNDQLGWETTKTLNGGLDASLFNNRLSFNFDIYSKRTKGILTSLPYNATYGWSTLQFNAATLSGHGYEFGINGQIIRSNNIKWSTVLNFGYATNKVSDVRFINNTSTVVNGGTAVEGLPIGYMYVYRAAGLDNKGQTQIYDRNNNIISNTTNLTTAFTKDDLKYAGVTVAPYSGGFFNNVSYKGLMLGIQISYYLGHVFLKPAVSNYPTFEGSYTGVIGRQLELAYRWRQPGDEATTNVPGLTGVNFNSINRYRFSDDLVRKADNVRLQQISLGYTVPQKYLPKGVFKSLSVSANMRNIGLLWTANKEGLDPQYLNNTNFSSLSPTPSYVFGLNASF